MTTQPYDIQHEPAGEAYQGLVSFLEASGSTVGLVVRTWGRGPDAGALVLVEDLASFVVDDTEVSEWPGTQMLSGTARLVRFRIVPESIESLRARTDRLYGWQTPLLPEDLCVWRPDGTLLLGTIAHEKDGWLELTQPEFERLSGILRLKRHEP